MEKIFWNIYNAKNENELHDYINSNQLFSDPNNWYPYGGKDENDRGNFGTFENQQPSPVPALIEKITNSIDSLLMKECKKSRIAPESQEAPSSMAEAVEKFFSIKKGDFSEVSESGRRDIAENIQILAEGDKSQPNIIIYDNGEGQHPENFSDTFLSLQKNNKAKIKFVQGKYNMGSTGAVVFCGDHRYQLIASRMNSELNINSLSDLFGFTIVRRHPLTAQEEIEYKNSWYEYFRIDGKIPSFKAESLDLGLYNRNFEYGSIVKLFSYQLKRGSRSDITFDLWRDLNQYLYNPALPVLLYENRDFKGKSPTKLMLGNKTRIVIDNKDLKEEDTKAITLDTEERGLISVEATVFKPDVDSREFIKGKSVVFTINGQVQGHLPVSFISQDLGFSYIKASTLIQIDCTEMKTTYRQDLFMANRTSMKEGKIYEDFIDYLKKEIKSMDALKRLNEERKNYLIKDASKDDDIIKSLASKMPRSQEVLNLLTSGLKFKTPYQKASQNVSSNINDTGEKFKGKRYPSIFKINLKENNQGKYYRTCPLNSTANILFDTDVEDEYLFRPNDPGEMTIAILGYKNNNTDGGNNKGRPRDIKEIFDVSKVGPDNGKIKISLKPKDSVKIGDEVGIRATLSSPNGDLENTFWVKILEPQKEKDNKPKEKDIEPPSLPEPIKVQKGDNVWNTYAWTEEDIVKVNLSGDKIDSIFINMDSFILQKYISQNKIKEPSRITTIKNKYFSGIYFHSLYLYSILSEEKKIQDDLKNIDLEQLISDTFKSYGYVLLYFLDDYTFSGI